MEKKRTPFTSTNPSQHKTKDNTKKSKGDYGIARTSSHTQYFRKERPDHEYKRITSDEYLGYSESLSASSISFRCIHGSDGKRYSEKGLLKRHVLKELDPTPKDPKFEKCQLKHGWDILKTVEFLVTNATVVYQHERLESLISDVVKLASKGYKIDYLDTLCTVLDFFVECQYRQPDFKRLLTPLLINLENPILLNIASDIVTHFNQLRNYMGYLGYLLLRIEDDELFDLVSRGINYQLSAPDSLRTHGGAQLRHTLAAATPLYETTIRMIAIATPHRFPTYLNIALLLACESTENCIEMMKENIIEHIFYRFSPFFPESKLPDYENVIADPQDVNLKLGDSSIHLNMTLSLLLVLMKTTKQFLDENPEYRKILPCPDYYSQRCFIWAYRYECLAREHTHERITLTVIAYALLNCFGDRLHAFAPLLMPDVLALSVLTELPPRSDWTRSVNFNTSQSDVQFKKLLIYLSVEFIKIFPQNKYLVESHHFLLGLMYLLDPALSCLRVPWSPALFEELRKTAFQALVCTMPLAPHHLAKDYGMIRRLMWYIEWYSVSPYELPVLYWCVRLLQVVTYQTGTPERQLSITDLFQSHGIIILMHLCDTLLEQKWPPVEKSQAIIALILRLLTSAVVYQQRLTCCVYPDTKWPSSSNSMAKKMLEIILYSLENHYIVSNRWLISLLNFIWEAIIWKKEYRQIFVRNNGIYQLLDLITMVGAPVQCVALAVVCDVARAGEAVGQLVTWRASLGASNAHPNWVRRGATIATLLAAIFRDDCRANGIHLDENGIIKDGENPLLSLALKKAIHDPDFSEGKSGHTTVCLVAGDLAGSRMSKTFALLYMLSQDLEYRVTLADEAYNLYKNIKLAPEDEVKGIRSSFLTIYVRKEDRIPLGPTAQLLCLTRRAVAVLVLCSHYLTVKLNEVWMETQVQSPGFQPQDDSILSEFLQIGKSWAKQIKLQQEEVIEKDRKKEQEEENSLYAFLGRVRLNIALDALREVCCVARSSNRTCITHTLLQDVVRAHHRRSVFSKKMEAPILKTYRPTLDDQNIIGLNEKVYSIFLKNKPQSRRHDSS